MSVAARASNVRVDQFFTGAEARFRSLAFAAQAARAWERNRKTASEDEKYQAAKTVLLRNCVSGKIFLPTGTSVVAVA